MWRFLVALGGFTLLLGVVTIVFGSVIFVSTIGNALIGTGAIGFTGGALIIAVGFVLKELEQLRLLVQAGATLARRPEPAAARDASDDIAEAAMLAVSQAVAPEPTFAARAPAPEPRLSRPEPLRAPEPEPAPAPEPEPAPEPVAAPPPPPVEAPAPRPRGLSFADRLRPSAKPLVPPPAAPPAAPAPRAEERTEDEVPVVERRGRILPRGGEGDIAPPVPRPRSLLDRMSLARPAAERPVPERVTPELSNPEPRADPREPEAEPHAHGHAPEPHVAEPPPPAEPPAPEPEPVAAPVHSEPAAPEPRPYGAPPPRPAPEPMVLKSGIVGGMAYTLYSDGSIQAELPDGVVRFASLMELREHVSRAQPPE